MRQPKPVSIAQVAAIFAKGYAKKSAEHKQAIDKALRLMAADLRHGSLRTRKMAGHSSIWEAHATLEVVMTFDFASSDTIRLRNCCNHNIYKRP